MRWLREHPEARAPSAGLCDYLQISPATLNRLFQKELGHGPREEALRLRLAEARRLIKEERWSVKAAAYHLGYKHPNDLSRRLHSGKA
jgi:transcriptional regulator GlxA family with amidase domain